jgi:hypothetical protein
MNQNGFTLKSLTAAINNLPYIPQRLAGLGWFVEKRIPTLDAAIEERDGVLSLLGVKPRGGISNTMGESARRIRTFRVPHIPASDAVYADEVQNVRAFASDNQAEAITTRRDEKLGNMRNSIDYTIEAHRVKALKGTFVDANGADISLFTEFGVTQQTKAIGLHATNNSGIRAKMFEVATMVQSALGGVAYRGIRVMCGDAFWIALLSDKATMETYLNQQQAAELRGNPTDSFVAFGATWEWYRGTSDANLGSDAYAVPEGVADLFQTHFAPADYVETVNTLGLPYYAKAAPIKFDKGWELEAQSNPLNICTRPKAIIKLTIS